MSRQASIAPVVVCSVLEAEPGAALESIRRAPAACALVELRADRLTPSAVVEVVRASPRPLVVTVRRREDGGLHDGDEAARRAVLLAALGAGVAWIDVERSSTLENLAAGEHRGRVILSQHGLACRIEPLRVARAAMARSGAARLKLVPHAVSVDEAAAVAALLAEAAPGPPLACFATGPAGAVTRLLAPSWGSWATYGSVAAGRETGAGQYPAADLVGLYDVTAIGPSTRRFALVGACVQGSPSPAMHRAGYRAAGIDARYFALETERFEAFVELAAAEPGLGLAGFAVTMPFKEQAAERCSRRDAATAASGATNTVLLVDGGWHGFNTDAPAALGAVRRHADPRGSAVAVLGAGGTARAVAWALAGAGARVTLYARDPARAAAAARAVGASAAPWDAAVGARWDVLVNATPLGARGEEVLPAGALRGRLVLDAPYAAEPTPLVRAAVAAGLAVVDGVELLARQAALQFERMTGVRVAAEMLEAEARRWLGGDPSVPDSGFRNPD